MPAEPSLCLPAPRQAERLRRRTSAFDAGLIRGSNNPSGGSCSLKDSVPVGPCSSQHESSTILDVGVRRSQASCCPHSAWPRGVVSLDTSRNPPPTSPNGPRKPMTPLSPRSKQATQDLEDACDNARSDPPHGPLVQSRRGWKG